MVLFHAMINLSPFLIPNNGAHYDPFVFSILLMCGVAMIVFLGGGKNICEV
jgi:hypothetical protein